MFVTTLGTFALQQHPAWGDGPGGWWVIFPILWFLFLAAVVTTVVVAWRRRGRQSGQRAGERRLAERYAAGEIDEEEYRSRLSTLKGVS